MAWRALPGTHSINQESNILDLARIAYPCNVLTYTFNTEPRVPTKRKNIRSRNNQFKKKRKQDLEN